MPLMAEICLQREFKEVLLKFTQVQRRVVSQFEVSATIISFSQDYQLKIEYLLTGHERFQVASF